MVELCIGPMSKNVVDAAIELVEVHDFPLTFIASRRQIDAYGGYVNNWTTAGFAAYVRARTTKIRLARDHGGPYQGYNEKMLLPMDAMHYAIKSIEEDIKCGFEVIHIDPTHYIFGEDELKRYVDVFMNKTKTMYKDCWKQINKNFKVEVGTDEGKMRHAHSGHLGFMLDQIRLECERLEMPLPEYFVINPGNYIRDTTNVGKAATEGLYMIISDIKDHGIKVKVHSADYCSNHRLKWLKWIGIDAINIAPELGVIETDALMSLMDMDMKVKFEDLVWDSKKWVKWVKGRKDVTKTEAARIAGHYVFSTFECLKIKAEIRSRYPQLNSMLKNAIKEGILRYIGALEDV